MAAFVLSVIVNDFPAGQVSAAHKSAILNRFPSLKWSLQLDLQIVNQATN